MGLPVDENIEMMMRKLKERGISDRKQIYNSIIMQPSSPVYKWIGNSPQKKRAAVRLFEFNYGRIFQSE